MDVVGFTVDLDHMNVHSVGGVSDDCFCPAQNLTVENLSPIFSDEYQMCGEGEYGAG
jgi:hypothetical protein